MNQEQELADLMRSMQQMTVDLVELTRTVKQALGGLPLDARLGDPKSWFLMDDVDRDERRRRIRP